MTTPAPTPGRIQVVHARGRTIITFLDPEGRVLEVCRYDKLGRLLRCATYGKRGRASPAKASQAPPF